MNNIHLTDIFVILITHYIADFILQTDEDAKGKSANIICLLKHTITYTLFWCLVGSLYVLVNPIYQTGQGFMYFIFITFTCHTIQDYFISRLVKKYFDKKDFHTGFVVIGFDQLLHYFQLIFTFQLLI